MRRYKQRKRRTGARFFSFLLVLVMAAALINYARPLPRAQASVMAMSSTLNDVSLSWPAQGSAALGAQGFGVLATHGSSEPRPTASMAKIITVLAILEKHPMKLGSQGATLTLTSKDVDLFNKYYGEGGSYVKVEVGEKITQYQAMQAILLPSANNMADSLATWSFGSMGNYLSYANDMLKRLHIPDTHVDVDASGFSPKSTSTASSFILLGELAMKNPVIAQIVAQKSATIPVHGVIYSANSRLGYNNIIGIKTGLTDQAGGCFLFAANYTVPGTDKPTMIIGVIMGAPTLLEALNDSEPLLNSAKQYFSVQTPIKAGDTFATLTPAWNGTPVDVVAQSDAKLVAWAGKPIIPNIELAKIGGSLAAGTQVGSALLSSGDNRTSTPLVLKEKITGPTWQWRIKRI